MLRFNVSHSHGLALCAVARSREIGVDVERVREGVAGERIAEQFFSRREVAALRAPPPHMQTQGWEFGQSLSDSTQDQAGFLPKTLRTLNNWFPSGYTIRQDGPVTSFVTVYREVEGLPSNLRGEVAVRISFPYDPNGNQCYFRVYTPQRLYPKKSDDLVPQTRKVFDEFARRLLQDLRK